MKKHFFFAALLSVALVSCGGKSEKTDDLDSLLNALQETEAVMDQAASSVEAVDESELDEYKELVESGDVDAIREWEEAHASALSQYKSALREAGAIYSDALDQAQDMMDQALDEAYGEIGGAAARAVTKGARDEYEKALKEGADEYEKAVNDAMDQLGNLDF